MDPAQIPGLIQAGGVIAFAFAVWWELRQQRVERARSDEAIRLVISDQRDVLTEIATMLGVKFRRKTNPRGVPIRALSDTDPPDNE